MLCVFITNNKMYILNYSHNYTQNTIILTTAKDSAIYRLNEVRISQSILGEKREDKSKITLDEMFLSFLGGIQNNDLVNVLDINDVENNEIQTLIMILTNLLE